MLDYCYLHPSPSSSTILFFLFPFIFLFHLDSKYATLLRALTIQTTGAEETLQRRLTQLSRSVSTVPPLLRDAASAMEQTRTLLQQTALLCKNVNTQMSIW